MSKTPSGSGSAFDPKAWIIPVVVTGVLTAAVVTYPRAAEIHAAAGSPYYPKAAAEALAGLRSPDEKQAVAAVPVLPAGLSADEHYCRGGSGWRRPATCRGGRAGESACGGRNGSHSATSSRICGSGLLLVRELQGLSLALESAAERAGSGGRRNQGQPAGSACGHSDSAGFGTRHTITVSC
jgi:hypothetical protein